MNPRNGSQNGDEIRRLRKEELRISGRAFAKRVGITSQALSNIELGNKAAGLDTLIAIARELNVKVDQIIREDEPAEADKRAA
jgi:transcriptional regulator with XRE-family HTH domain